MPKMPFIIVKGSLGAEVGLAVVPMQVVGGAVKGPGLPLGHRGGAHGHVLHLQRVRADLAQDHAEATSDL